jgi:putative membrane protein
MMGHGLWGGCCSGLLGGFGSMGIFGPILNLVLSVGLIIGLVIFLVWIVRRLGTGTGISQADSRRNDSLDILKTRYAKGEITQQEFMEISKDLK